MLWLFMQMTGLPILFKMASLKKYMQLAVHGCQGLAGHFPAEWRHLERENMEIEGKRKWGKGQTLKNSPVKRQEEEAEPVKQRTDVEKSRA